MTKKNNYTNEKNLENYYYSKNLNYYNFNYDKNNDIDGKNFNIIIIFIINYYYCK